MDGKQSPNEEPSWQFKPGETISPHSSEPAATEPAAAPTTPNTQTPAATDPAPVVAPQPETTSPTPVTSTPSTATQPTPEEADPYAYEDEAMDGNYISWTASEFIAHEKTAGWHVGLVAIAVVVAALAWFITKDVVTPLVIVVAGGVLSFYGARRPNQLQYQLSDQGLQVGNKYYAFGDFRSFAVMPEGALASIALTPSKRFSPLVSLYFDPQDGDKIVDILGSHLPHQDRKVDAIDGLMRRIRF